MFSGIIEHKSKILNIENGKFTVENKFLEPIVLGQSIAHDWACMTITEFDNEKYSFFAMEESLKLTNFWSKKIWDSFNIERCLKIWDRLDGHMVSGHVDNIWEVSNIKKFEDWSIEIFVKYDKDYSKYLIPKWSITINWTSLTIVQEIPGELSVCLIPLTQEITNLWDLIVWSKVNLEFDLVWKFLFKQKSINN